MTSYLIYRSLISTIRSLFLWLSNLFNHNKLIDAQTKILNEPLESPVQLDLQILNCRVKLTQQEKDNTVFDAFTIEICGSIHTPITQKQTDAILKISIMDITNVSQQPNARQNTLTKRIYRTFFKEQPPQDNTRPIQSRAKKWQMPDSPQFLYNTDLGKLPAQVTRLSGWTDIAQIKSDWLIFPRKGNRKLQFNTSICSRQSEQELACTTCTFVYENPEFGYIDLQKNVQRTKTLTVALAFAVSASDEKLYNCEIDLIKNWAKDNIDIADASNKTKRHLDRALKKTVAFFRDGNHLDTHKICKEIVQIAPLTNRYDILELCLYVAQAKGFANAEELAFLKNLATWLEVDNERFRETFERILPVNMHETKDVEVILGVTSDMSSEKTRQQLNKLFCKWNSRVTNLNPAIREQADQMLKLIAEARNQYIG